MANWTASTLLSRVLELVVASERVPGTWVSVLNDDATKTDNVREPATTEAILAKPALLDTAFPKASDLIEFLKSEVIKEAMKGPAHVTRPTKKKAPKPKGEPVIPGGSTLNRPITDNPQA